MGNLNYVLREKASPKVCPNGIRDAGNEGKELRHFLAHPIAEKAELSTAHVAALRLATFQSAILAARQRAVAVFGEAFQAPR